MRWEDHLDRVLDDLEQQADGLALAERDALVSEQRPGEYAGVDLVARLHASVGSELRVQVVGSGAVQARLTRVGDGWLLLAPDGQECIVRLGAVSSVRGLSGRATATAARPVTARLSLASALRGVASQRVPVSLTLVDGSTYRGLLGRVGGDFVEVVASGEPAATGGGSDVDVVLFDALAVVRSA